LSLRVVRIAFCVDFVTASAEIISGEQFGRTRQQISRKFDGVWRGETKLPSRRLVSIRRPRTGFSTRDVLGEGLGDDRSVTGGVDLGNDINTALETKDQQYRTDTRGEKLAYLVGILDDICDLGWSIDLVG